MPTRPAPTPPSATASVSMVTSGEESGAEDSHFVANDSMNNSVIENSNPLQHLFTGPLPKPTRTLNTSEYSVAEKRDDSNEKDSQGEKDSKESDDNKSGLQEEKSNQEASEVDMKTSVVDTVDSNTPDHKVCDDMDTTVIDNNTGDAENASVTQANTTVLETTLVNHTDGTDNSGEHVSSSASDNSGSEESPLKTGGQSGGKKTKTGSGKKSSKMVTIKRGKGRSLLQDLNANTGSEGNEEKTDTKAT